MMWFRNLQIYRLAADHALTLEAVNDGLAKRPFVPCGPMDLDSCGWVPPAQHEPDHFAIERQGAILVSLKTEEKVLPAAVIRDELDYRVGQIEEAETRKVGRTEQRELRDRIVEELTPRAFTRSHIHRALIDLNLGLVIVDAASAPKAEFLLSTLRETLGSLPTRLIDTEISPCAAMTDWLTNETPDEFSLGQAAELRMPGDEGSIAKFKRQVMDTTEVKNCLESGKIVTKLALAYGERLTFTLGDGLELQSLAMLDVVKDELKDMDAETQDALYESQFALLVCELRSFIPAILAALGGERARDVVGVDPAAAGADKTATFDVEMQNGEDYVKALEIVLKEQRCSISQLQRHLRIHYNRAAFLIEVMERRGIVSAMESNGSRTVLAKGKKS